MHIVFHTHHADVSEALQQRAEQAVRKLAARLRGTTDASVRFAEDGTERRVEIVLRAARRRPLVAAGEGARYEIALADAVERLGAHVAHAREERERRVRRDARAASAAAASGRVPNDAPPADDGEFPGDELELDLSPARRVAGT